MTGEGEDGAFSGIHAHLDVLGEQAEDVLDFPSARVGIGSKLVWEYI